MSDKQSEEKKVPTILHAVGISLAFASFSTIYILNFIGFHIFLFVFHFSIVFFLTFISTIIGAGVGLRRKSFRAMWIGSVAGGIISFFVAFYILTNLQQ